MQIVRQFAKTLGLCKLAKIPPKIKRQGIEQ